MIKKIQYDDKTNLIVNEDIPRENKVIDEDMNEIKEVVNNNADEIPTKDYLVNVSTEVDDTYRVNFLKSKNLFIAFRSNQSGGGATLTANNDGSITITGTNITTYDFYSAGGPTTLTNPYLPIKLENGDYTLSGVSNNAGKYNLLAVFLKSDGTNIIMTAQQTTTLTNVVGVRLFVRTITGATLNDTIYPMLNKGETVLPYEPYITPSIYVDNEMLVSKNVYSESEVVIGEWLGKPLYRKVVNFGALPNNTSKEVAHNISDLSQILSLNGIAYDTNSFYPIPMVAHSYITSGLNLAITSNKTKVKIATTSNASTLNAYVTIEYTKTTD